MRSAGNVIEYDENRKSLHGAPEKMIKSIVADGLIANLGNVATHFIQGAEWREELVFNFPFRHVDGSCDYCH